MLRRLNVRTRLVAVIAVPLVLLLAIAIPEAAQRRDRAREADQAASAIGDVAIVATAVDALQAERTLSAAERAGDPRVVEALLADQRARTDDAIERTGPALTHLGGISPSVAGPVRSATTALSSLDQLRSDTDAADSIVPWVDGFTPLIGALLDVEEAAWAATGLGVDEHLQQAALLDRMKDATAAQAAQVAAAATWGELRGDQAGILDDLRADEATFRAAYLASTPTELRSDRRTELTLGAGTGAGRLVDQLAAGDIAPPGLIAWLNLSNERQQIVREASAARADDALARAQDVEQASRRSATVYLGLAGAAILLALGLALAVARSITRPLRRLTDAADHLAEERLPRLVDALRHPVDDDEPDLTAALEPIDVRSSDELGHLAHAFNEVQAVAVDVAVEQSTFLKKGISDLYVNLARRNQALIDRQIQLLDRLEGGEEDPEVLEHLYLLDHLATRMRRNAESLLVLAGSESGPRRSKPVEVVDVVRAALSEVEEYERVEVGTMAHAVLHGPGVSDVAHLVAELLENSTHFSPPETAVRVDGVRTGGSYQLVITDQGVGMPAEQLDELNAVFHDPPVTGLALGRSLGCLVAARLAARHGITVRLRAGEHEGMSAFVVLPRHLLVEDAAPAAAPRPVDLDVPEAPDDSWDLDRAEDGGADGPGGPAPVPDRAPLPSRLVDALPARRAFDEGLQALLDREGDNELVEPTVATTPDEVEGEGSSIPLRRRVPGATAEALEPTPDAPHVRRSPDEVRSLLSRYRSGLLAGRVTDGPDHEEGS